MRRGDKLRANKSCKGDDPAKQFERTECRALSRSSKKLSRDLVIEVPSTVEQVQRIYSMASHPTQAKNSPIQCTYSYQGAASNSASSASSTKAVMVRC